MEAVFIKIIVIVVSVLIWLALVYMAERQARKQHRLKQGAGPAETSPDSSQPV